jgi:hypothetical protein
MSTSRRPVIDGIPLPDPAAIERQRRREQPYEQPSIQPTIHDINEEGYRRWIEEQERGRKPESERGVVIIQMCGDDDE